MDEIWKPAIEQYEISNLGNVRKNGKVIGGSVNNRGYRYFQLNRNGKRHNYLYHHLVAVAFIGERPYKYDIDHINRNKLDNTLENLRYITHKENSQNCDRFLENVERTKSGRRKQPSKATGIRRQKGEGQLYQRRPNGSWRAIIIINNVKHEKSFHTKEEAEAFLNSFIH